VRHQLDLLGVLVLAVATGVGGGIIRDLILGDSPPAVFQDEWYFVACILGGLLVFFGANKVASKWNRVMLADAIGLGLFAAIGAAKAQSFGLGPIGIVMMSALTAVGGGIIRDLLVLEVPAVIQKDFYATAALIGGLCYVILHHFTDSQLAFFAAIVVTIVLRLIAMKTNMNLPKPKI